MWQMLSMSIASCLVEEFGVYTINNKDRKGGRQEEARNPEKRPGSPNRKPSCWPVQYSP